MGLYGISSHDWLFRLDTESFSYKFNLHSSSVCSSCRRNHYRTLRINSDQDGGKWKAVLLCLTCILTGSCFGLSQNAFQPVIFDQLFWVLSFYLLISFIKTNDNRYLIFLGVSIALIALSGNSGLSNHPHLHFDVTIGCMNANCQTVKYYFKDLNGKLVNSGQYYSRK